MSKRVFLFRGRGKWLSALPETERMEPPTTVRVVEERIATIDEFGNRRGLIRIRTLTGAYDPIGRLVEVERERRYTLPGFGHVYQVADDEYIVFHGRLKLRVDPDVEVVPQQQESPTAPVRSDEDSDDVPAPSVCVTAPVVGVDWRREPLPLYSAIALMLLLTLAAWQRHSDEPAPSFVPLAPAMGMASSATAPDERDLIAAPAMLLREDRMLQPPTERTSARTPDTAANRSDARLALSIRPWGEVYVNGKKLGMSPPMKELKLPPGRYNVEVRNPTFEPYRENIELRRSKKQDIAHDFGNASKAAAGETGRIALASRPTARFLSEEWPR